jgi:hypothetical protein
MKKLILILSLVLISIIGYGQATPTADVIVLNATDPFAVNISVGTGVWDKGANKFYKCITASVSTLTLTTGAANFYQVGGAGLGGTVTSVGLAVPSQFTVSGSPVTTAGTMTATWADTIANKVFAGPASGGAAKPRFRSLVSDDIPSLAISKITGLQDSLTDSWNKQDTASANGLLSKARAASTYQTKLTFGIANTNSVVINSADVTNGEYAKFTASGLESKTFAEVKSDLGVSSYRVQEFEVAGDSTDHCILTLTSTPISGTVTVILNTGTLKSTTQWAVVETNKIRISFTVYQYSKCLISYSY